MLLFHALSGLPLWTTAVLLLGVATCLAAIAPLVIRRAVGFERLVVNNEIAGFQYSTLGTSYAVLLAMAVIAVWGDFRDAQRLVDVEASSWGNLYQLAEALPEPGRASVQAALRDYVESLIDDEWPAMQQGRESQRAAESLWQLRTALLQVQVTDARVATVYDHMLDRLIELSEGRRSRLDMLPGSLPPLIDLVLVLGAVITIGFTLFFAGKDVRTQALMTGMLGLMINLVLLAAVELNFPFAGGVRVSSLPIENVMRRFAGS
jgi:Protein of unknown function (DUF4239)